MDDCDEYANCTNTIGSFLCMCRVGFTGDGVSCAGNNYVVCKLNSLVRMGEGWGYSVSSNACVTFLSKHASEGLQYSHYSVCFEEWTALF